MTTFSSVSASFDNLIVSGNLYVSGTFTAAQGLYIDNLITVGLPGSSVQYNSIKTAVDSITDATAYNTYTVEVAPGVYIEDTITVPSYVAVRGDSSTTTIVSASNPNNGIFIMSDQSMVIDMQIQGSTGTGASAILYSSATTPQLNAIAYAENIRFGSNYTNASTIGLPGGNCILQCSNVKYGGATENNKSFDIGFRVSGSGGGIGRMQLRNVTSTNGGITGSADQVFALADASGCTFIVNGCLLTKAVGSTLGTGFKVYNGGSLRLTGVNFQRWAKGIWAPQTGSAPSIDAIALNFENCTVDVAIEHSGSTGKVQGTDNFLKTQINLSSSLYEVGQDPRIITVATKGGDFTSISASVAYITDSSAVNRYVIQVGPGQFTEKEINLVGKPYVSIVGSSIQTTQIFPSSSNQHLIKMGINNEVSFLTLTNAPTGYSALYVEDVGDFAQAHKLSFYDCDTCLTVISRTQDTKFYGEYLDYNGTYRTGSFISSSNGFQALASLENYYQFPVSAPGLIANWAKGGVAEFDIYTAGLIGELDGDSVAIRLEDGADMQGAAMDIPRWGDAVSIPYNTDNSSSFNIVGSMIHDSVNRDFRILHPSASCRFQGTADHSKISNNSANFFWTFLDENDGELDITRNLAVTFANGIHTDASTLIFRGSPMGVMEGGVITDASPGDSVVQISSGFGYLESSPNTGVYQRVDFAGDPNFALDDDTENFIFIDADGNVQKSPTEPDSITKIFLGRVYVAGGRVQFIDQVPRNASHTANLLSTFNRTALGPVFAEGSEVAKSGTNRLNIKPGRYYFGENQFSPTGGNSITFTQYYRNTGDTDSWNKTSGVVDVVYNTWDSGSNALVALSSSYYTKHTLYLIGDGAEEQYFLVVGQQQFSSLVSAEAAGLATPPNYFTQGVVPIGAVYVQSGSGITQIEDIRPIIGFRAGGVNAASDHGNLTGLADDDHTQYLLVNGTRAMTGPLTASIVSASSGFIGNITGSLFGTASYALTASVLLGSVASAATVEVAEKTAPGTYYLTYVDSNNTLAAPEALSTDAQLNYNPSTDTLRTANISTSGAITGSIISASNGITGSLFGTATSASYVTGSVFGSGNPALSASYAQSASFAVTASYLLGGAAANITVSAGTATSAVSSLVFQNLNNVSFGLNGNTITATATVASTQASINISAAGSSNNISALVFSNTNNVDFGLNGSTITAQASIHLSDSVNTAKVSQLVLSNANNISFGINGGTITATANVGGGAVHSFFQHPPTVYSTGVSNWGTGFNLVHPFQLPYDVSISFLRVPLNFSYASSTFASTANTSIQVRQTQTYYANIYTRGTGASSLSLQYLTGASISLVHQASATEGANSNAQTNAFAYTWYTGGQTTSQETYSITVAQSAAFNFATNVLSSVSGVRMVDLPFATSLPEGDYWIAFQRSFATATTGLAGMSNLSLQNNFVHVSQPNMSFFGFVTNNSTIFHPYQAGAWSKSTQGVTTVSIPMNEVSTVVSHPNVPFQLIRFA